MVLTLALASAAFADQVSNRADLTPDTALEGVTLNEGAAQAVPFRVIQVSGDGDNNNSPCNIDAGEQLVVAFSSNNASVATLSPQTLTFTSCGVDQNVTVTAGERGTATISASESSNTTGGGTFDYAPASFSVVVNNVAPTISNIADRSTSEDASTGAIAFTVGDAGTPAGNLTVSGSSSNTTLVPNSNITFGGSGANRTVAVTPEANRSGTATITVTVSDGAATATDTFVLTVNATNDAPTISAVTNGGPVSEGSQTAITVTATDAEGDTLTYSFDCDNDNAFEVGPQSGNNAQCNFNDDGTRRVNVRVDDGNGGTTTDFTNVTVNNVAPSATFNTPNSVNEANSFNLSLTGASDPSSADTSAGFTYAFDCGSGYGAFGSSSSTNCATTDNASRTVKAKIRDKDGGEREYTGSVNIDNVSPTIHQVTSGGANEGSSATINVTADDPAGADDPLSYSIDCDDDNVFEIGPQSGSSAQCSFADDGNYTVNARVTDGDGGEDSDSTQVSVSNVAPTATLSAGNDLNVAEGTTRTYTYAVSDPGDDTVQSVSTSCGANGTKVADAANSFDCHFSDGPASSVVSVQATDSDGDTGNNAVQTVSVANVKPSISLSGPDSADEGQTKTYTYTVSDPGNDTLSTNSGCGANGTKVADAANSFDCHFPNGPATTDVTAQVTDSDGANDTDDQLVEVTVANAAPNAVNDLSSAQEAGPDVNIDVLANDTDVSGDTLTITTNTQPPGGGGSVSCTASDCTFSPDANFNGTTGFTYTISDSDGATDTATVTVTVSATNDAPTISNIADLTIDEDNPTGGIAFAVEDMETAASGLTVSGNSSNTTLVPNANITFGGSGANRTVTVTPAPNQSGTATITVGVDDGAASSNDTFVLTVSPVNDDPIAHSDSYTTAEDTPLTVNDAAAGVLGNDLDIDSSGLTATLKTQAAHGTVVLNPNGTFTYTPSPNFNGSDSFTYTVSDGVGGAADGTVNVMITGVNDAPEAHNDSYTTAEDTPLTVNAATGVLSNDSDVDNDSLSTAVVNGPAHGQLTLNPNGSFTYTPEANYNGPDSFTYRVNDGVVNSNVATVTLGVSAVNDSPTILPAIADRTIAEDTNTGEIAFTISDVDNAVGDLTPSGSSSNPTLVSNAKITFVGSGANRTVKVTPEADRSGTTTITVSVSDGMASATDSFVLSVSPVAPQVTSAKPSGQKVSPKAKITVAFSEEMNEESVEAPGVFTLKLGKKNLPAKVVYNAATKTVTLTPTKKLTSGARYTAIMLAGPLGAKDIGGDMLALMKQWKFKVR